MKHLGKKGLLKTRISCEASVVATMMFILFAISPRIAAEPTPSNSTTVVSPSSKSNTTTDTDVINKVLGVMTALLTLTTAVLTLYTVQSKSKLEKAKSQTEEDLKERLHSSEERSPKERRQAIIVVGLGGAGKTTLLGRLMGKTDVITESVIRPDPRAKTGHFRIHSFGYAHSNIKYHIADSPGQSITPLISELMKEQKKFNSPMTFGAINSIIFVVDVAAALEEKEIINKESVRARINVHVNEWSKLAIDLVYGITLPATHDQNGLRYVCLFINKADLLEQEGITEEFVKDLYRPLINRLRDLLVDATFECIVGSFEKGDGGLRQLEESLVEYSWPGLLVKQSSP